MARNRRRGESREVSERVTKAAGLLILFALCAACGAGVAGDAPVAVTPASSPASAAATPAPAQTDARGDGAQAQAAREPAGLRCEPERLRRGDTLTVELAAPHGGHLTVVNPRKRFFFLTAEGAQDADRKAGAEPLVGVEEFSRMSQLRIDTSRAKAVDWSREWPGGEGEAEPVFSQTGWYEILVGAESIEQEGAPYDFKCRVHYDAEPR